MCGGQGTRLGASVEKPLYEIDGAPMLARVLAALGDSRVESVACAVSPHTPATRAFLADRSATVIDTPGEGYVPDLGFALEAMDRPVLTTTADLPLLAGAVVEDVLDRRPAGSTVVCVPTALKQLIGASVDRASEHDGRRLSPTGLNVVGAEPDDARLISYDARLAVNVNEPSDATIAEALACD